MSRSDEVERDIRERNVEALTVFLSSFIRAEWAETVAEAAITVGFRHPGIKSDDGSE